MVMLKKIALLTVATLATSVGWLTVVNAQDSGVGLNLSPPRFDLAAEPGQDQTISINLTNLGSSPVIAEYSIVDFEADGQTGDPKILADGQRSLNSVARFLDGLEDVSLDPYQTKTVDINVKVGSNIPAGAYYGIVKYQPRPLDSGQQSGFKLSPSVGAIVLLEVSGGNSNGVFLDSLELLATIEDDLQPVSGILLAPPDKVVVTITNNGQFFAQPVGELRVKNSYGKIIKILPFNQLDTPANILPGSSRQFELGLDLGSSFGRHQVVVEAELDDGRVISSQLTFWVIPAWLRVALVSIVCVAITLLGWRFWRVHASSTN